MIIEINNESISCDMYEIFKNELNQLLNLDSAEIWISEKGGQDGLPCLSILVNNEEYVINYFGDDGSNYVSVGRDDDREVSFCDGTYDVAGYQIVSKEFALQSALYFFKTKNIFEELKWDEL